MHKKRIAYHRLWYFKKRHLKHIHIYLRIVLIVIILMLCLSYANKKIIPNIVEISETRLESSLSRIINETVNESLQDHSKYKELVAISRDESGNIISVGLKSAKLNLLSTEIEGILENKLNLVGEQKLMIPSGMLLGNSIFAAAGPNLSISILPYSNVEAQFFSEFEAMDLNQAIYIIYINVKAESGIKGLLFKRMVRLTATIPVFEEIFLFTQENPSG